VNILALQYRIDTDLQSQIIAKKSRKIARKFSDISWTIFHTSFVWLSKEYDFALDDLNLSVLLSDSDDLILSIIDLLTIRSPIWR